MKRKEPRSTMQIYHEICRACMRKETNMKSLFKAKMNSLLISEIFSTATPVIVTPEDGLPSNICTECLRNLTSFYKFQQMCVNSDIYMRNALISHSTSSCASADDDPLASRQYMEKSDAEATENVLRPVLKFEYDDFKDGEDFENLDESDELNFDQENLHIMSIINGTNRTEEKSMIRDEKSEDGSYIEHLSKETEEIFSKVTSIASNKKENTKEILEENSSYKCKTCPEEFIESGSLIEHRKNHENSEIYADSEIIAHESTSYDEYDELEHSNSDIQVELIKKEFLESDEEICYPSDLLEEVTLTSCPANCSCENCSNMSENVFVHGDTSLLEPKEIRSAEEENSRINCIYCGLSYSSFDVMRKHIKRKHKNKKVPSARMVARKKPPLTEYRTISLYQCNVCNETFKSQQILLTHKKQFHSETKSRIPQSQIQNSTFTSGCPVCGKELNKKRYRKHLQLVHKKNPEDFQMPTELIHPKYKPVQCYICFRKFSHNQYLQKHLIVHKKTDESIEDQLHADSIEMRPKQNRSTPLSETFSETKLQPNKSKKTLKSICNICGKCLFDNRSLKRHLLTHDKFKTKTIFIKKTDSKCQVCHREFSSWYALRRHIREIHLIKVESENEIKNDTNLHPCELCNKIFLKRESLILHKRIHSENSKTQIKKVLNTQESDFSMNSEVEITVNSKAIHKSGNLQKTETTRENQEKSTARIRCLICKMLLCSKHSLLRHMSRRHKESLFEQNAEIFPFQCAACTKIFQRQQDLIAHMKAHRVDVRKIDALGGTDVLNLYKCNLCTKTFKRSIDLAFHKKRGHVAYVKKKKPKTSQSTTENTKTMEMKTEEMDMSDGTESTKTPQPDAKEVADVAVRYECHFCQTIMKHLPSLLRHLRERHGYDKKTKELVYKYFCNECKLFFESQEQLNKHNQQTHISNEDPLAISTEGKEYENLS